MIQKIGNSEYLKRLNNMTAFEKEDYLKRVGEWLEMQAPLLIEKIDEPMARFQNIIQCGELWNDDVCKAWSEGVRLLTACASSGETWLPEMLYVKAAKRSIKRMVDILGNVNHNENRNESQNGAAVAAANTQGGTTSFQGTAGNGNIAGGDNNTQDQEKIKVIPVRPKHIDQYVHVLPKATQERASQVQSILRNLDAARENARKLEEAGEHPDTIAQWAKIITNMDNKLKSIYQELNEEWDRLAKSGAVTVDDFGRAHLLKGSERGVKEGSERGVEEGSAAAVPKKTGRPPLTEEQKAAKAAEREAAKKAEQLRKAALIRKWLIDKRNAKTDAQKEKWMEKYKEMIKLGGEESVTDKVREAAEYYEVEIG